MSHAVSTGPGLCTACTDREVSVESFWMPDVSFPASQLKVNASMMQTKWISSCWCTARKHKHSQSSWRVFFFFNECCISIYNGCVSPSLQPTSSRVARTLGLFEMASWLARTSAWGWLCHLNVSLDILWLEKLRSHVCMESAGTGITHSRVVKVIQKVVPWPFLLWCDHLNMHVHFAKLHFSQWLLTDFESDIRVFVKNIYLTFSFY